MSLGIVYNVITIQGRCAMASIVYQVDKKTGAKYAFESVSYWDKEKKQPRSKRRYLGKVDPETGNIIPSRGRSSHSEDKSLESGDSLAVLHEEIRKRDQVIAGLRQELDATTASYNELLTAMQKVKVIMESV